MKINQLRYYDHKREWRLEPIQFSNLNLLVGVSGVGKSQILESINTLKKITTGESFNGVEWDIKFTTEDDLYYHWMGEFEHKKLDGQNSQENECKILKETLVKNQEPIIERVNQAISFKNQTLPKLSSCQSAIHILAEEEDIAPVKKSFRQIQQSNYNYTYSYFNYKSINGTKDIESIEKDIATIQSLERIIIPLDFMVNKSCLEMQLKEYPSPTLENLHEIINPIKNKLVVLIFISHNFPDIFERIKNDFIQIFPFIEDIKIEVNGKERDYQIKFKEKGVDSWINEERISSGMRKTFFYIIDLYTYPNGTVILIDEFENSLGVNCIDTLSNLISENRDLQFIITSHHPYIINKIGMQYWKIITRKGGIVTARDAREFNLGKSRHEAFMQLINLDAYTEGVSVE